jgi:hypothetical protein
MSKIIRAALASAAIFAASGPVFASAPDEPANHLVLERRLAAAESRIALLEDRASIENLTRAYGYYIDKKLWSEVTPLFSANAEVEISGRGLYRGSKSVARFFSQVLGRGKEGLADGELSNHMVLQGVTNIAPDGKTATARWRAFIQIGIWQKMGLWSEGTYDIRYVKEDGVWKFALLRWYGTYFTPYDKGWANQTFGNNAPSKEFPPDAPPTITYDAFPGHYVPPFPYPNPVSGRIWTQDDSAKYSTTGLDPNQAANAPATGSPIAPEPR